MLRTQLETQPGAQPKTMSTLEIAAVTGARHDKVKQSVERLAERGVIVCPPLVETTFTDSLGGTQSTTVYWLDERSSTLVVSRFSVHVVEKLYDRWKYLETLVQSMKPVQPVQFSGRVSSIDIAHAAGKRHSPKFISELNREVSNLYGQKVRYERPEPIEPIGWLYDARYLTYFVNALKRNNPMQHHAEALDALVLRTSGGDPARLAPLGSDMLYITKE